MYSLANSHAAQDWKQWLFGRLFRFLLLCLAAWFASSFMSSAHALPAFASSSSVKVETHYMEPVPGARTRVKARGVRVAQAENRAAVAGKKGDETRRLKATSARPAKPAAAAKSGAKSGVGKQPAQVRKSARKSSPKQSRPARPLSVQTQGIHSQPWSFGGGQSAAVWGERGIGGRELYQQALPAGSRASAGQARSAQDKERQATRRKSDSFDLQVDKEYRTWQARHDDVKPDEEVAIDSQHRVRAFARVQDENVTFGLGPEVIVRDQNQSSPTFVHKENQPDVDAGLGMQFKLDF